MVKNEKKIVTLSTTQASGRQNERITGCLGGGLWSPTALVMRAYDVELWRRYSDHFVTMCVCVYVSTIKGKSLFLLNAASSSMNSFQ